MKTLKTTFLLTALTLLLLFIGQAFGGRNGMTIALVFAILMNGTAYFFSDKIALMSSGAVPISREQSPRLYAVMERLAAKANLPMPKLYLIPQPAPNAFATGRNPSHASVAVTQGLMDLMDDEELEGVIAHELSHVRNYDILTSSIAATIAGSVTWIASMARWDGVCGAPQGAVISPILANVYLHYVFDLWVHRWRLTKASGDMIVTRYADDTIVGFQHEHVAQAFLDDLKERMRKFELALHPDKTRLIRFGRQAVKQREKLGEGKPETFDFLGFTHFCTRSRKWGSFVIGRKTIKKRMRAKLLAIKIELRKKMHDPIAKTGGWMKQMLQGHLNYFAISGNHPSLWWFFNKVRWLWLAALKRRSQKARLSWEKFIRLVARFFPPIKTLHPLPCHRFDAKTRGRSPVR